MCYLITSTIGRDNAADLFWECQANLLISSPEYFDLGWCLQWASVNIGLNPQQREYVKEACKEVRIYPETVFEIKDSSGCTTVSFDDSGNLYLTGTLHEDFENVYGVPLYEVANEDEFVYGDGSSIGLVIENDYGNLWIDGFVHEDQGMSGANGFIIKNSEGETVAYIETDSDVYLSGFVFEIDIK